MQDQDLTQPEFTADHLKKIDDICNAFEEAFGRDESPILEDFLSKADEELQRALLPELMQLELHYRPESTIAEMSHRFPQLDKTLINEFGDVNPQAGDIPSIPGYFLMEELGRGGMGIVYRAADLTLHRHVAVKMIRGEAQANPEHRRRFLGEARAAARLHHPNLVQIFDTGEFEGHPFLVFEIVEGGTLADQIKDAPLSFDRSAQLVAELCDGLQYAHERHIVHRDLKPSNILLGTDGVPQISDFGLAKRLDDEAQHTISGMVVGTPSYMAPEQADGLSLASTPAVDIYSLGAILYELLTGQPPFKAASVMETLEQLRTKEPVAPRTISSDIPRDLETICLKCLQKTPAQRYASAAILSEELGRFARGESIIASPVGSIERTRRWCRRHPLPATLATALLLLGMIAFYAIAMQRQEAISQRSLAETNATNFRKERDKAVAAMKLAVANATETEAQRAIAEQLRKAAEDRFEKAQGAIHELILIGTQLVRQPQMESTGRRALNKAAEFGRALWEDESSDPAVRLATQVVLQRMARMYRDFGQVSEAQAAYQHAIDILESLHEEDPQQAECLHHLTVVYGNLASCLQVQSQLDAAEIANNKALKHAETLIGAYPDNTDMHNTYAAVLKRSSFISRSKGQKEEAFEMLMRVLEVRRRVVEDRPGNGAYRRNLAKILRDVASVLWLDDRAQAETLATEALEIRRREVALRKQPRGEAVDLVSSLRQLADFYSATKRNDAAEALLDEAIACGRNTRRTFPGYLPARLGYIHSLKQARNVALSVKKPERAIGLLREMREESVFAIAKFPDEEWLKQLDAWLRHESAVDMIQQGNLVDSMTMLSKALDDLQNLQVQSSHPDRFTGDIRVVANTILATSSFFEFEEQKMAASQVLAEQSNNNADAQVKYAWRQLCVQNTAIRTPKDAELAAQRGVQLSPENSFAHLALGVALYYQDKFADSAAALNKSLDLESRSPAMNWYFLAMIQFKNGNGTAASELFQKAMVWHESHTPLSSELQNIRQEAESVFSHRKDDK